MFYMIFNLSCRFCYYTLYDVAYRCGHNFSLQSSFGCSSFVELLSGPYTDSADAGSLPEELDPFPELQLGNPQGVSSVDESAQSHQSVHHQQPSQPPPPPPPLPEDIQADSLRYVQISIFKFLTLIILIFTRVLFK